MLTLEQMSLLKRVNVSVNPEKTMARIKEDFSAQTNKKKTAVIELSGQTRSSFYGAFRKGTPSARIVLAMSQILNVSPFYYTGAEDDKNACDDDSVIKFLSDYGYKKLVGELISAGKKSGQPAAAPGESAPKTPKADKGSKSDISVTVNLGSSVMNYQQIQEAIKTLSEDDAVLLFRALLKRAVIGGEAAKNAEIVKMLILS